MCQVAQTTQQCSFIKQRQAQCRYSAKNPTNKLNCAAGNPERSQAKENPVKILNFMSVTTRKYNRLQMVMRYTNFTAISIAAV